MNEILHKKGYTEWTWSYSTEIFSRVGGGGELCMFSILSFSSRASPCLVARQIWYFCHSGDHRFQHFFAFKPLLVTLYRTFIAGRGQPECQPDVHPWTTHAYFRNILCYRAPLIPTKWVPECPILVPETPISTLQLVQEPPHCWLCRITNLPKCDLSAPPPPHSRDIFNSNVSLW